MKTTLTNVRNIPPDIKAALVADAEEREWSVADVGALLLSAFFEVDTPLSNRRTGPRATSTSNQLQMRVSRTLLSTLWATAREWKLTQSQTANRIWANHYGIPYTPINRRGGAR